MAQRRRCKHLIPLDNGKTKPCGIPLDAEGICPEHGKQK